MNDRFSTMALVLGLGMMVACSDGDSSTGHTTEVAVAATDAGAPSAKPRAEETAPAGQAGSKPLAPAEGEGTTMPVKCPPEPSVPPRADGAPTDDILDLRPGMSFDDVVAISRCRDPKLRVDVDDRWHVSDTHGIKTRQIVRVSDGEECSGQDIVADMRNSSDICSGGDFKAVKNATDQIFVAFNGVPEKEVAGAIWRSRTFAKDERPTVADLQKSLAEKYGEPHETRERNSELELAWTYDPLGRRMSKSNPALQDCRFSVSASYAGRHRWSADCGLTINARIDLDRQNPLLADALHVAVMQQKEFIEGTERFEADLRTESRRQNEMEAEKAVKPEVKL